VDTDKDFLIKLGANIKKHRMLFNISQVELANRIGMDKQNLWTIEKGKSNPQILTLVKIAGGIGITLPILLGFDFEYENYTEKSSIYLPRKHKRKNQL
jgi:transcriptional regulator with XRE-family HTH domain